MRLVLDRSPRRSTAWRFRAGHAAGELLARARQKDVIDAAVVLLATNGDVVLTSDAEDLASLTLAAGLDIELVPT